MGQQHHRAETVIPVPVCGFTQSPSAGPVRAVRHHDSLGGVTGLACPSHRVWEGRSGGQLVPPARADRDYLN